MSEKLILLVEDNPDDEALAVRALERGHPEHPVVVVRDGAEALDWLNGNGPYRGRDLDVQPAIVLLDLQLPKLSGLEVLRRLRAEPRTALLRVVVLTSSDEEHDVVQSYRLGAASYVRKPVEFERFDDAIRQLGDYWLSLNLLPPTTRAAG